MNTPGSAHFSLLTRRDYGKRMVLGAAALAAPLVIPSRLLGGKEAPGNRIRAGQIGCGRIARSHDIPGVYTAGGADFVAVCDVDSNRARSTRALLEEFYKDDDKTPPKISVYGDYRELIAREDIDAVVISTPDHWHAEPAIAAVLSGKDVYLQKPMTMTHAEGVLLRDAVNKSGRILQIGSQQRSWKQFREACELVRSGRVGRLTHVEIGLPIDPTAPDKPPQPVPANLDYDRWLGPAANAYYTEQRVHSQKGFGRPGWLRNESFCLGMITGWGAHHFDTAHWGMNLEHTGPLRIEGRAGFPANKIWNVHGAYNVSLTYPGNIQMTVSDTYPNGIKFIGEEGWIFVARDGQATSSDPASPNKGGLKALDASKPALLDPEGVTVKFTVSKNHHGNWLDCVRSRRTPLAPADIGHRSNSACILSWIAMKLGRPLTWDAQAECFVNDAEANAMLSRPERAPYGAIAMMKAGKLV
jgi:predicted dehydrogenase